MEKNLFAFAHRQWVYCRTKVLSPVQSFGFLRCRGFFMRFMTALNVLAFDSSAQQRGMFNDVLLRDV